MLKFATTLTICIFSTSVVLAAAPSTLPERTDSGNICRLAIESAEVINLIPGELLQAVSLVESGKWNKAENSLIAWPWTVTVEGKGYYYDNEDEALANIQAFQQQGIRNIDVGCMQINLAYHGDKFKNLSEILNPINNVAYGASYLSYLRVREKSWTRAVKFYHSANREFHEPYRKKVITAWQNLRKAKMSDNGKTVNLNSKASKTTRWPAKNFDAPKNIQAYNSSKNLIGSN